MGSIIHEALDVINQEIKDAGEISKENIEKIAKDTYYLHGGTDEEFDDYMDSIFDYYNEIGFDITVVDSEVPFSIDRDNYRFNGAIDLIYKNQNGEYGILDYKNTIFKDYNREKYAQQLLTYILALKNDSKYCDIEITEAIEEKVSEKLSKLDKYFIVSENVEAKVLVRTYPYGQKIEVTIPTEYVLLRAEVVDQDLYNAIDLVIDKLEGQIRKYKTRLNRKSKDNKLAFNLASIEPLEEEEEDVLVKTKTITPKPMDMEEAIMQMELIGHSFFVYRDTETDAISIVYRRNDGNYGLIETE